MEKGAKAFFVNLAAILLAALLFAAIFPNPVFSYGLPFLAWVAFVPVFWVIRRTSLGFSVFYGAVYGYTAYALFNYWLTVFNPIAGIVVHSLYLVKMALLFPLLRLTLDLFPRRFYIVQWLIWMAYEYLRTLGFLGYSYGISGYSQWNILPLIQIADITGVWGVSALVVFPSAWLAAGINSNFDHAKPQRRKELSIIKDYTSSFAAWRLRVNSYFKNFFRKEWASAAVWLVLLIATVVYGFVSPIDYSEAKVARVLLIQHNTDPWLPARMGRIQAFEEYRNDFRILRRLSDEALAAHPYADLVVWSETAFVPRIHWHNTIRDDPLYWQLVRELLEYLREQDVPFVIGNDDTRRDPFVNPVWNHQVHYNAAILFERGEIIDVYRKIHLVPFTEHFPFERQFPRIHQALLDADTHFWHKGTEFTIFETRGFRFSTPICFEDTFGYLNREFVLRGAELFVNLSNKAWSNSLSSQMQQLTMAVFRSVENRRSMVRSTASGQTSAIDPNGRILAMAEPFTEAWLFAEVPVLDTPLTFYTRHGDYLGKAFTGIAFFLLIIGTITYIIRNRFLRKYIDE